MMQKLSKVELFAWPMRDACGVQLCTLVLNLVYEYVRKFSTEFFEEIESRCRAHAFQQVHAWCKLQLNTIYTTKLATMARNLISTANAAL